MVGRLGARMKWISLFCLIANALTAVTTQEALERLIQGNKRYVADELKNPDRSSFRRLEVQQKQNPYATIVGCSDSRVPPEIVFDAGIGDLFIVRVAGQVVGPVELDSIEYSVKYLGSSAILVLGHESCGAVTAVLKGETADIENIAQLIEPAIDTLKKKTVENAVKANVRYTVAHLKEIPVIKQSIKEKKIEVIGGYYHLSDGHVEILN